MKNSINAFKVVLITITLITAYSLNGQQNILTNGGFESNPPTSMGNNKGYSVVPWKVGSGDQLNVVRVDGPGGFPYDSNGPQSDASGVTNEPRHYLDIVGEGNSIYQSFTPACSGSLTVGGYFSTRNDTPGIGSIEVREGDGLDGLIIGESRQLALPGGDSEFDAWTHVSKQVNVLANQTYSFIVIIDNFMNFDEGYAKYVENCEGSTSTCCDNMLKEIESIKVDLLLIKKALGIKPR